MAFCTKRGGQSAEPWTRARVTQDLDADGSDLRCEGSICPLSGMAAEVDVLCNAGYGEGPPAADSSSPRRQAGAVHTEDRRDPAGASRFDRWAAGRVAWE